MASSWEEIADEVAPMDAPVRGLATGALRRVSRPANTSGVGGLLAEPVQPRVIPCPQCARDATLDEIFGGAESVDKHGAHYRIVRAAGDYERDFATLGERVARALGESTFSELDAAAPHDLLFVDIETTGLSSGAPLFLIGTLRLDGDTAQPQLEFFLARSFDEEKAALAAYHERARGKTIVTFNGKSFDWPYIAGRSAGHSLRFARPPGHLDLLTFARRTWRERLPNCKLQTLEKYLCERERVDDVPSSRIPATYHKYLELQNIGRGAHLLAPIVHHNALDILTMAELMGLAAEGKGMR